MAAFRDADALPHSVHGELAGVGRGHGWRTHGRDARATFQRELTWLGEDAGETAGGEGFEEEAEGVDADLRVQGGALVHEDDRAGADASHHALHDRGGIAANAVEAADVPTDAAKVAGGEFAGEENVFDPGGAAKPVGLGAAAAQRGEAFIKFAGDARPGGVPKRAERMGVRVMADVVAAAEDFGDQPGVLGGALADGENVARARWRSSKSRICGVS